MTRPKDLYGNLVLLKNCCGSDGHVRAAKVRAGRSDRCVQLIRRSIKHLYPIEVSTGDRVVSSSSEGNSVNDLDEVTEVSNTRRRREAAIVGEICQRMNT